MVWVKVEMCGCGCRARGRNGGGMGVGWGWGGGGGCRSARSSYEAVKGHRKGMGSTSTILQHDLASKLSIQRWKALDLSFSTPHR